MTHKQITYIVIIILLSINLILLQVYRKKKLTCKKLIENISSINESKKEIPLIFKLYSETHISETIRTQILKNNPFFVDEFKDHDKVVAFIPKGACGSCISALFIDLDNLSRRIGFNRIIIATNMQINGTPIVNADFPFKHYYIEDFFSDISFSNEPYLFVMNKYFDIKLLFIPELFPDQRLDYFDNILIKHFEIP